MKLTIRTFIFLTAIAAQTIGIIALNASAAEKPNFLIIVADDLCWRDLGCQGNPDVKTPNIDRLASEGMRLEGMFSPAATCSPLRHSLYTGLYPIRSGAYPNHTRDYDGVQSIFSYLKEVDYRVALQNKEHVGPKASFPYEHINGADDLTETEKFIRRDNAHPWLLVYASNDPHSPWNRGPKDLHEPSSITVPPYMHDNEQTRKALVDYYREVNKLDSQVGALLKLLEETKQVNNTLVMFVSEQGCSLPYGGKWTLYDTGIRVSAFVRWPGVVKPGSSSTALMQYVDVTPTLVEIAGVDPMSLDSGHADAEGVRKMDGRSFLSVLQGKSEHLRDYVFAQHTTVGVNGYEEPYPSRMVRDERFKLIRNLAPDNIFSIGGIHKGEPYESWKRDAESNPKLAARFAWLSKRTANELYDLEKDPFEMNNLADDRQHADIQSRLQSTLAAWMRQQGDEGLATENLAPERQGKSDEEQPRKRNKKAT